MKFRIISVGKISEAFYRAGVQEYMKRLQAYGKFELVEGLEAALPPKASPSEIEKLLHREGEKILNLIGAEEEAVILDISGKTMSSESFSGYIGRWNESGKSRINFIVGSSFGLDEAVKKRANAAISFSPMTFPHQLAVLMLTEQIYRGFRILRGEPYHK